MPPPGVVDRIFALAVSKRTAIIGVFKIIYLVMGVLLWLAGSSAFFADTNYPRFYTLAVNFGRMAIVLYTATNIPGIAKRLGVNHKLIALLRMFRRYIGISMYLAVLFHSTVVQIIPVLAGTPVQIPLPLFIAAGLLAETLLFLMFITSNDFSVNRLGIWWYRLHKATYVVLFLIFTHVALQRLSIWSFLIGGLALAQVTSFVYAAFHKPRSVS